MFCAENAMFPINISMINLKWNLFDFEDFDDRDFCLDLLWCIAWISINTSNNRQIDEKDKFIQPLLSAKNAIVLTVY